MITIKKGDGEPIVLTIYSVEPSCLNTHDINYNTRRYIDSCFLSVESQVWFQVADMIKKNFYDNNN